MYTRYFIFFALLLSILLYGCGGSSQSVGAPVDNGTDLSLVRPTGPGMPVATPEEIVITDDGKIASASYLKFFADSVNQHSTGRWTSSDNSGYKQWTLSNTAHSAPKAWVMGGNYYNYEDDTLKTNDFSIADNTDGIVVTFYARWNIAAGDSCGVYWWIDGSPTDLIDIFSDGQNPSYPAWDKFYYQLPANFSGNTQTNNVEFYFTSNSTGNGWGFGVDNIAVYQRQLEPPLTLDATDGLLFSIEVSWSHNNQGTLIPDGYAIYRADDVGGSPGTYSQIDTVAYPTNQYFDAPPNPFVDYWYKATAYKSGWPTTDFSNEDTGWYDSI